MSEPVGGAEDPVRKVGGLRHDLFSNQPFLTLPCQGGSSWADDIPVHERTSRGSPLTPSNPMLPPHHSLYKARARAGAGALPSWQPGIPAGRAVAGVQGGIGLALPNGWGSCVREGGEG